MSIHLIDHGIPTVLTKIVHSYRGEDLDLSQIDALPPQLQKKIFSFSTNQDLAHLAESNHHGHQLTKNTLKARRVAQVTYPKEAIAVTRTILQEIQNDPTSCKKQTFGWPLNAKAVEFCVPIPESDLPKFEENKKAVAKILAEALKESCLIHVENFPTMRKDIDYFITHRETRDERAVIAGLFKVKEDAYESCDFHTQFDLDLGIDLLNRKEAKTIAIENAYLD